MTEPRHCYWSGTGKLSCPDGCPHNTDHRACFRNRYPEMFRPRDHRPLREVFPTASGHRLRGCPYCGRACPWSDHDDGYVCTNDEEHHRHPDWPFKAKETPRAIGRRLVFR